MAEIHINGRFLVRLREHKKLTQDQMAKKIGVPRRTYQRWEASKGVQRESFDDLCQCIRELFHASADLKIPEGDTTMQIVDEANTKRWGWNQQRLAKEVWFFRF